MKYSIIILLPVFAVQLEAVRTVGKRELVGLGILSSVFQTTASVTTLAAVLSEAEQKQHARYLWDELKKFNAWVPSTPQEAERKNLLLADCIKGLRGTGCYDIIATYQGYLVIEKPRG